MPDKIKTATSETQELFKKTHADVKWVQPNNVHLSLAFLGDIFLQSVDAIKRELDETVLTVEPFSLELKGVGSFGSDKSIRIIWAGVNDSPALAQLQSAVAERMKNLGIFNETRTFRPHLTLGRVKSNKGLNDLRRNLVLARHTSFGRADITRIVLMRSQLTPAGAEYSILHIASLIK